MVQTASPGKSSKLERIGTYEVDIGYTRAELVLQKDNTRTNYIADFKFQAREHGSHEAGVAVRYTGAYVDQLFLEVKRAEGNIERILSYAKDREDKWKGRREVMQCIFSLEKLAKENK